MVSGEKDKESGYPSKIYRAARWDIMKVSYKRLWKLLIDKDMKKKDLVKVAHISTYTINKLNRGDNVNTDTLVKICSALNCSIEDIMEVIPGTEDR